MALPVAPAGSRRHRHPAGAVDLPPRRTVRQAHRQVEAKWLKKWGFHYDDLYMRLDGTEYISSKDVKRLYVEHLKLRWKIKHMVAIDDDLNVLKSYKEYGMIVFEAPKEWEKALTYHRRINTLRERRT